MKFSDAEKQKAAEREWRWRRRVYPRRVELGRMTVQEANYQEQIMEEIAQDYREKAQLPLE